MGYSFVNIILNKNNFFYISLFNYMYELNIINKQYYKVSITI